MQTQVLQLVCDRLYCRADLHEALKTLTGSLRAPQLVG
jgi:hypothetical protein